MRVSKKIILTILSVSLFVFSVSCSNEKTTGGGEAGGNGGSSGNSGGEMVNLNPEAGNYKGLIGGPHAGSSIYDMKVAINDDGSCKIEGVAIGKLTGVPDYSIAYTCEVRNWTKDDTTGIISSTDIKRINGEDKKNMKASWQYVDDNNQKCIKLEFTFEDFLMGSNPPQDVIYTNQGIKVATIQ